MASFWTEVSLTILTDFTLHRSTQHRQRPQRTLYKLVLHEMTECKCVNVSIYYTTVTSLRTYFVIIRLLEFWILSTAGVPHPATSSSLCSAMLMAVRTELICWTKEETNKVRPFKYNYRYVFFWWFLVDTSLSFLSWNPSEWAKKIIREYFSINAFIVLWKLDLFRNLVYI